MSYYGAKKFDLASQYLEPPAKADPGNAELHQMLAQSCLWAKKLACAQDEFQRFLQQSPDSAPTHVLMGEALDGLGRTPEAITEFETAAKISPSEPNVHFGLGYLHWKSQQYDEAKQEFETRTCCRPQPRPGAGLSRRHRMEEQPPRRSTPPAPSAQIKANKDLAHRLRGPGRDLSAAEKLQRGEAAFLSAVALDPAQPDAHYQLGRLYQALGKTADAEKELHKVRELHEKAETAWSGRFRLPRLH